MASRCSSSGVMYSTGAVGANSSLRLIVEPLPSVGVHTSCLISIVRTGTDKQRIGPVEKYGTNMLSPLPEPIFFPYGAARTPTRPCPRPTLDRPAPHTPYR